MAVVDRRRALALAAGLALLDPSPALASSALLSERLERKDLSKPVFNKARPGPQRYPDWLEGTWRCTATFAGFEFPSKTMSKSALIKEPTIPGFQKLSLVYVPDVGTSDVSYCFPLANGGFAAVCVDGADKKPVDWVARELRANVEQFQTGQDPLLQRRMALLTRK